MANYPEPISAQRLIHGFSTDAPAVDPAKLRATRDHMAARGTDGQGAWLSPDGRLGQGAKSKAHPISNPTRRPVY